MNTTLTTLVGSGFKNWKTTALGLAIALLTAWKGGVFEGKAGAELAMAVLIAAWGFLSRDANKSSQDSGVRLWWAIPFLCASGLTSCATNGAGAKTFMGLDAGAWSAIGLDAGKAAIGSAVPSYLEKRAAAERDVGVGGDGKAVRPILGQD